MGQEFIIKSQKLEDKVNQLLPSQGGFAAGVDLSASTTVIPIVDLTETAEGSDVRADLQTAFSFNKITAFNVSNSTTTIINTTGFYRVFGTASCDTSINNTQMTIILSDGLSNKIITNYGQASGYDNGETISYDYDFVVKLEAGDTLSINVSSADGRMRGCTRQIADINGNLTDP